jgi:hypothetical protein
VQESNNTPFTPSSSEGVNRYYDRFDVSHFFERRHSLGTLTYSQNTSPAESVSSPPFESKLRSRAVSVTEGVYSQPDAMELEEDQRPKKDPMKHMMLKGQLMDF